MEDNEKYNIALPEGTKELVIRHGEAKEPERTYHPKAVSLSGTITAPADFAEKRESEFNPLFAHVIANFTNRTIQLRTDELEELGYTVTGKLALNPELASFTINAEKTYNHADLYAMLRFKGAYFTDRVEHEQLLGKLRAFKVKIDQEFENSKNNAGTSIYHRAIDIKHDIGLKFRLELPLYPGEEKNAFDVEICVDYVSGQVIFWLESPELYDDLITSTEEIFNRELSRLEKYVIVKQY